jgi:hypothetical protein
VQHFIRAEIKSQFIQLKKFKKMKLALLPMDKARGKNASHQVFLVNGPIHRLVWRARNSHFD